MNSIYIVFGRILDDGFEIFVVPEGPTITFLVCCVHRRLIQYIGGM